MFDANGGNVSLSDKTVTKGETYGDLPTPTRNGYTFDGWFTAVDGGTQVTASAAVNLSGNQTLYAHWTKNIITYTVIWLNGDGEEIDHKTYKEGQTEPTTDKVPTKAADADNTYTFSKWTLDKNEGNVKNYKPEFMATVKATQIETVSVSGQEIQTTISSSISDAIIFCAIYNNSGKMISICSVQVTSESNYQFDGQKFDYAKIFIVDRAFCPLCKSKRS